MTLTLPEIDSLSLLVNQEIRVRASLEVTFAALLEQLGPGNETPDGKPMSLKLEPWPGGRWFRDLGDDNGHLWAHVQAIKRPTLLEFAGPLFMSQPVANNVQYRLSEDDDGTLIKFRHSGFGLVQEEHKKGVVTGWGHMNEQVRKRAEGSPR
jgi:Activator of Hsp90 ATPase homolog 1-like protein